MIRQALVLLSLAVLAQGQNPPPDPAKINSSGKYLATKNATALSLAERRRLSLKKLSPGIWKIGQVLIDQNDQTISFPATFEVTKKQLEYALVNTRGKVHESLLITDVLPAQLHYAVQLLKLKNDAPLEVILTWKLHGPEKSIALSELIQIATEKPSSSLTWRYRALLLSDGSLAAQSEHSLISLIEDSSALIHHQAASKLGRDDIYLATKNLRLPQKGLPITVVLKIKQ